VRAAAAPERGHRAAWFPCACCPPNLMRMLGSWEQYLATTDDDGIRIHQFATADIAGDTPSGPVRLAMRTEYPADGRVVVEVVESPGGPWSLAVRVPQWARGSTMRDDEGAPAPVEPGRYWSSGSREWRAGDTVALELDMRPRLTVADPRIDAVRGCVALERGPLVYCVEGADLPAGVALEEVRLDADAVPSAVARPDLGPSIVGLDVPATRRRFDDPAWPYAAPGALDPAVRETGDGPVDRSIRLRAIPYFAWANRAVDGMRVWIPLRTSEASEASEPLR
jgi:DUF1680 family protein